MVLIEIILFLALLACHACLWWHVKPFPQSPILEWQPGPDAPRVSFLVPAWNAERHIPAFIAAFRDLSYPSKELVICAGGDDESFNVAKSLEAEDIKALRQFPGEGKQRALARSYELVTGDVIYLTDIDCRPNEGAVNSLLAPLIRGETEVVTGWPRPLDSQLFNPLVRSHWSMERRWLPATSSKTTGLRGCHAALKRSAVAAAGSFAAPASSGTDYTLAKELLRSGYDIFFVPGHAMPCGYPDTLRLYIRKQTRWIRNVFVIGIKYRSYAEVRRTLITLLLPYALILGLVLGTRGVHLFAAVSLLFVAHTLSKRMYYQKRSGFPPSLLGSCQHFIGDQLAAIRAGIQALSGRTTW